jgi:hypothetical protein
MSTKPHTTCRAAKAAVQEAEVAALKEAEVAAKTIKELQRRLIEVADSEELQRDLEAAVQEAEVAAVQEAEVAAKTIKDLQRMLTEAAGSNELQRKLDIIFDDRQRQMMSLRLNDNKATAKQAAVHVDDNKATAKQAALYYLVVYEPRTGISTRGYSPRTYSHLSSWLNYTPPVEHPLSPVFYMWPANKIDLVVDEVDEELNEEL